MLKAKQAVILLSAILLTFLIPDNIANAHSVLEKAIPENEEQLQGTINSIKLTFNTKIENGSTLSVTSDKGEKIEPASVKITNDVLDATFKDPLEPGTYQVNWKIVGADGHPIENQYSFSIVAAEGNTEQTDDGQNSTVEENKSKNDGETTAKRNNQNKKQQQNSAEQENEQPSLTSWVIIVLIIVGIVLLAWMMFSKRKK
ncbi:copper resistance CopC family protein [Virgibacillus dakarensis]|uniref:copper resistance CopC family protein n=1 Tax=Virgibacillus dakarensis TaxID=1917889 RepID=UPI00135638D7|nr:copper resistance CopC family protein [Virgibacillus dakarensis]